MRHLDEGRLQAWLDGPRAGLTDEDRAAMDQHLALCPECAARVKDLQGSTRRVHDLLHPAGEEERPEFDRVVARARAAGAKDRRRRWWVAAGWAASIAVALGVGWLASERSREPAGSVAAIENMRPPPAPAAQVDPPAGAANNEPAPLQAPETAVADAPSPPAVQPEGAATEPEIAAVEPEIAAVEPEIAAVEPDPAAEEPAARPEVPPGAGEPVVVRGRIVDAATGQALPGVQVTVDGTRQGTLTRSDGTFALALDSRPDSAPEAVTVVAALIGYGRESRALDVARADTVSSDFRLSPAAVALEGLVVTGASGPDAWRSVSRAEAEEIAGFPVRTVPGLPLVGLEARTVDAAPRLRVVQALEDGALLVLLQAARPIASGEQGANAAVASRLAGGVFIVASAPLPPDSLRALLARIR